MAKPEPRAPRPEPDFRAVLVRVDGRRNIALGNTDNAEIVAALRKAIIAQVSGEPTPAAQPDPRSAA